MSARGIARMARGGSRARSTRRRATSRPGSGPRLRGQRPGLPNIRETILFPRGLQRVTPSSTRSSACSDCAEPMGRSARIFAPKATQRGHVNLHTLHRKPAAWGPSEAPFPENAYLRGVFPTTYRASGDNGRRGSGALRGTGRDRPSAGSTTTARSQPTTRHDPKGRPRRPRRRPPHGRNPTRVGRDGCTRHRSGRIVVPWPTGRPDGHLRVPAGLGNHPGGDRAGTCTRSR